jgi:uncharacterized protein YegP (UPF0339 family)
MAQQGAQFYTDSAGEHRWRVVAGNGSDILGDSGEGYKNELDCAKGLLALVAAVDVQQLRSYCETLEKRAID